MGHNPSKRLSEKKLGENWLSKYLQVMDGTVVDDRKIIHTEFGRFADALEFALSLN